MKPLEEVIQIVNALLCIDVRENLKVRKTVYRLGRQLVMYVAQERLNYSDKQAGNIFKKDRVTALHARRVIQGMMDTDKLFVISYAEVLFYVPHQVSSIDRTYPTAKLVLCSHCNGTGSIDVDHFPTSEVSQKPCEYCAGSGRLEEVTWHRRPANLPMDHSVVAEVIDRYSEREAS